MNSQIFSFELNGTTVLGFDTGLNVQAFAQAKMAQLITSPGSIVYPDGKMESWQPGGVTELSASQGGESMIIWGPSFPGERMDGIINDSGRRDEALDVLRFWLKARMVLEESLSGEREAPFPGPAGAFIVMEENQGPYPAGTVFFPPFRLIKRTLDAKGEEVLLEAERWVHPDLKDEQGISFSAAAMLYRIFCALPPFHRFSQTSSGPPLQAAGNSDQGSLLNELHQDIREAVFIPPDLAAPGLDPELSALISRSINRMASGREEKNHPTPASISGFIGPPHSRPVSSWIKTLGKEEITRIRAEQEQFSRRSALKVKTRRFVIRNTAIITGVIIILVVVLLSVRGYIRHKEELPSTKGMDPLQVAEAYYGAFGDLDHTLMQACVTGKTGKQDIDTVMNLFVITRVRQAYEIGQQTFMSAQEWIDAGSPATQATVFGVTNLSLKVLSQDNGYADLEADYVLWMPAAYLSDDGDTPQDAKQADTEDEDAVPVMPEGLLTTDRLSLVLIKGAWQIAEINRISSQLKL